MNQELEIGQTRRPKKILLVVEVLLVLIVGVLFTGLRAWADTPQQLFEGYYKVMSGDQHVGYVIQSYGFDSKKKIFSAIYFIKTNSAGGNLTESLKAQSNDKFQPLNYQYTATVFVKDPSQPQRPPLAKLRTIDAKFSGRKMTVVKADGKNRNSSTSTVPDKIFLSNFLQYLMLQEGLKLGKNFSYQAIAEESAEIASGQALVKTEEKVEGLSGFGIVNTFKGVPFVSVISTKGEVLLTTSPEQGVATKLVANRAEAVQNFEFPEKAIKLLFGKIPEGITHGLKAQIPPLSVKSAAIDGNVPANSQMPAKVGEPGEATRVPNKSEGP